MKILSPSLMNILSILSFLFLSVKLCPGATEQMTLTTFYPAPFGAYDRIQLVPRSGAPSPCAAGTLFVDASDGNALKLCGGAGTSQLNIWEQTGDNIYPKDFSTANVGIGTNSPDERLHVAGNAKLEGDISVANDALVTGNLGVGKTATRKLDVEGDGQMNKIYLKADGSNVGELKVEYVSGGTAGYYATYAP